MAEPFKPPPLESHQGPAAEFTPPPPIEDQKTPIGEQPASIGGTLRVMGNQALETGKGALKTVGRDAYDLAMTPARLLGMQTPLDAKVYPATEPSANSPAQTTGQYITRAAELYSPARALVKAGAEMLPNAARAGKKFEQVMGAAQHQPIDLTKASTPVMRALELERTGAGAPPAVISKMAERIPQHGGAPMAFREARDFQSNAGALSASERLAAKPQMQAQVAGLAKALAEENQAAAERAGVGKLYSEAMNEYRRAKKLEGIKEGAKDLAKSTATKYVLGGLGIGAGYGLGRKLLGD